MTTGTSTILYSLATLFASIQAIFNSAEVTLKSMSLALTSASVCTEIGKKVLLFANLQPGRARKRINAT